MKVFKIVTKECYCSESYNDDCFEHKYTTFQTADIFFGNPCVSFTDNNGSRITIPYTSILYIEENEEDY